MSKPPAKKRLGRPPKPPGTKVAPASIGLQADVRQEVDAMQPADQSRSEFVNELLREALAARRAREAASSALPKPVQKSSPRARTKKTTP